MFAIDHPSNSKPTLIGLFRLLWHVLKLFGIFYKRFGIFVHLNLAPWNRFSAKI